MTHDVNSVDLRIWPKHVVRAGPHVEALEDDPCPDAHRPHIEPWLSALLQAEHLSLLVGSGLTTGISAASETSAVDMRPACLECDYADAVQQAAEHGARRLGYGRPNIEDQIRAVRELIGGLRILAGSSVSPSEPDSLPGQANRLVSSWESVLDDVLGSFVRRVLDTEEGIKNALMDESNVRRANRVRRLLGGFLLPFSSRVASRDRLHVFTTNYDRVIEYGCDLLGLRIVDRFVGSMAPVFHSSRLGIDLHYNPPGIRGEPRFLEGVVRFTKLHGSVDWMHSEGPSGGLEVRRYGLPFGSSSSDANVCEGMRERVLIWPNPAKDVETLEYPYAEMFRDFATAACQPNAVVITYGYGFGDDHVNRVLRDMLTIPSTHLVLISYDEAGGRPQAFVDRAGRDAQITLLLGPHFGDIQMLVDHYLPKPAIDRATLRMMELLRRRTRPQEYGSEQGLGGGEQEEVGRM